jgi:anaerobic selenocysteine-containing dehydrogenase
MSEAASIHKSACILCYVNCGIEVEVENGLMKRVKGDKDNPKSRGYICQKAGRLPFYANDRALRLTSPLRRNASGGFDEISWDVAIAEIAAKLNQLRETGSDQAFGYYGGGGQGSVMGGAYGQALRAVMGDGPNMNALSQEKTGDFWVNGHMFGGHNVHTAEDVDGAELTIVLGCNPWMANGFARARDAMTAIGKDSARRMIVIDPRRTEVADLADLHLALRPGTDAFLLGALLAMIVARGGTDETFLQERTTGWEEVRAAIETIPVDAWLAAAEIERSQAEVAVDLILAASSMTVRVDVGVQQSRNSTLNAYLEKLLYLITGNFLRPGCNGLHGWLAPMWGHSRPGAVDKVTGQQRIAGLSPANDLPRLILSDSPDRVRAMVIDSGNPANTVTDTAAVEKALSSLNLLVVIEVAMTESARLADYVLPACNQYERWENTLFNLEYPHNFFQLRPPLFSPLQGTLPEPEIYTRLVRAMGCMPPDDQLAQLRDVAATDRAAFAQALGELLKENPAWRAVAPIILYETLGATLPNDAAGAAIWWPAAHQCARESRDAVIGAGFEGEGPALGEALFQALIERPSGVVFTHEKHEDLWRLIRTSDGKVHLAITEILDWLARLDVRDVATDPDYPIMLICGQRRNYNANQAIRDPRWRKTDPSGALHLHPHDLAKTGATAGGWLAVVTAVGRLVARVEADPRLRPGQASMPHGYGQIYDTPEGKVTIDPRLNMITITDDCDPIARTPYHKNVAIRVELPTPAEIDHHERQEILAQQVAG